MLAAAGPAQAAFPGENGRIAFTKQGSSGEVDIYSAEADGNGLAQLTNDGQSINPVYSPDGTRMAFTSGSTVYIGDQLANNAQPVLDIGVGTWELDWSPDGTRLVAAFPSCADFSCESDIYLFGTDGSDLTQLTDTVGAEYNPSWSPDGERIAFDSLRGGEHDIYTIAPDGSDEQNITSDLGGRAMEPDWSPDGSKLAFEAFVQCCSVALWTANADGSDKQRQVLDPPTGGFEPAWSPDGERIAYVDQVFGGPETAAIRVTGPHSGYYRAYFGEFAAHDPDWQVRPADPSPPPPNGAGYARPVSAMSVRVPLVPAYKECRATSEGAKYQHGPPLSYPSCEPNFFELHPIAVGTPDHNGKPALGSGFVQYRVAAGDPKTPEDEADVRIRVHQNDVRIWRSPYEDAVGTLVVYTDLRVTDTFNDGGGSDGAATVVDHRLYAGAPCVETAGSEGATCSLDTSADALVPGIVRERRKAVWEISKVRAYHSFGEDPHKVNDLVSFAQGIFIP